MHQRTIDVEAVKGETIAAGHALTEGKLRALSDACTEPQERRSLAISARDAAMLATLFGAGVRRAEGVALDLAEFNMETGAIAVRRGRGNKARLVPLPLGAREAIDAWLRVRGTLEGDSATPLLCPVRKCGVLVPRRMTAGAVLFRTERRAIDAGIRRFSPHDARRTFISWLLESGADLATVRRLAGKAKSDTTVAYDRRGDAAKRQAVDRVPFLYTARAQGRLFERDEKEE